MPTGNEDENAISFMPIFDDRSLGIVDEAQSVWGTYLHGGTMLAAHLGAAVGESRNIADAALNEIADELGQMFDATWLESLFAPS